MLRREIPPLFAVVRLRKRNEWVPPKGKLDGETRAPPSARCWRETGHDVEAHRALVRWSMIRGRSSGALLADG